MVLITTDANMFYQYCFQYKDGVYATGWGGQLTYVWDAPGFREPNNEAKNQSIYLLITILSLQLFGLILIAKELL